VPATFQITIPARRFSIALAIVALFLVACHITVWTLSFETNVLNSDWHGHWAFLFDLDTEAGFGTWFSAAMLLLAGVLTLIHARRCRPANDPWDRWWSILGYGLVVLSVDEIVGLHEAANSDVWFTAYFGHWTILGFGVAALAGVALMPFVFRLPRRTLVLLLLAGVVYLAGAIGVEFATISYENADRLNTLAYNLWNALEEGLEMAGVILYLYGFLDYQERFAQARAEDRSQAVTPNDAAA